MTHRYLIATAANDIHAVVVTHALRHLGNECFRWVTSDFPTAQTWSISFGESTLLTIEASDGTFTIDPTKMDFVYWHRRLVSDCRVLDTLCESDRVVAQRESKAFVDAFAALMDRAHYSVNKVYAAKRAESKPLQLHFAKLCGLCVPETIITNDPRRIKQFANLSAKALAKPFSPIVWKSDHFDYVTRSAILDAALLPDEPVLQTCPMIFQHYVEKAFEVRVTYFRDLPIAIKIESQKIADAQIDWRAVSPARLGLKRIEVPKDINDACLKLMKMLDLDFGCVDMIVTPDGEWVFLELNQMGQFLWIEDLVPDIPMLDLFVQLLTDVGQQPNEGRLIGLRYKDFRAAACAELSVEQSLRVKKVGVNVVEDRSSLF